MAKKVYALYKGEEFISVGTASELAREFGHKRDWVYLLKPTRNLGGRSHGLVAYELKYEEGEEDGI